MKLLDHNPYDYNAIALRRKLKSVPNATYSQTVANPLYNTIGKYLGIFSPSDWENHYDKVVYIADYARNKVKSHDIFKVMEEVRNIANSAPDFNGKNITNIYLAVELAKLKEETSEHQEQKTEEKKPDEEEQRKESEKNDVRSN